MDAQKTSPDEFCTEVGDGGTLAVPGHCGCMALSACASLATKIVVQCEALPLENATARGLAAGVGHDAAGGEFGETLVKRLRPRGRVDGTQLGGRLAVHGDDDGAAFTHLLHQRGEFGFGFVE